MGAAGLEYISQFDAVASGGIDRRVRARHLIQ
jgi:hypothetical protein